MNILTNEIIENLNQKGIILNPFLSSYRSHSNLDIKHYGLPQINKEKQLYLDNNSSKYDLIIGTEFNVLFRRNSIREFKKINAKIDFVSLKKGDNNYARLQIFSAAIALFMVAVLTVGGAPPRTVRPAHIFNQQPQFFSTI